jgi:membrane protease YdiL (CAAX protease family)
MEDQLPPPPPMEDIPMDDSAVARWSIGDTWLGLVLQIVVITGAMLAVVFVESANVRMFLASGIEALIVLPIAIIFLWRKISWKELGFRSFEKSVLGMGCGLLAASYVVIIIHNLIMMAAGVMTQGDAIFKIFDELDSPILLFFAGVVVAPITEEMFFRGFLFKGFRQKYGWKAALVLSSLIFGVWHLQPAAIIPTFLLGGVLAYVYHRTNSLYPGIILHFMVNSFGLCAAFAAYTLKDIL